METRCGNCKFWDKYNLSGPELDGRCRRYPSNAVKRDIEWCGEWKGKESILPSTPTPKPKEKSK